MSTADVCVIGVAVIVLGLIQLGAGEQVTFDTQPGLLTEPSLLKTKVKQPSPLVEVNGPGIVVPQYDPAIPPGTFAGGFALAICVAGLTVFPS